MVKVYSDPTLLYVSEMKISIFSINPTVAVVDNLFDEKLAKHIIGLGQSALERAPIIDPNTGLNSLHDVRSNLSAQLSQYDDDLLMGLARSVATVVSLPVQNAEPAHLLHYQGEQEYKPHLDAFDLNYDGSKPRLARGGQRLFTTICYLNDCDGGGTEFPRLNLRVSARLGRVVVFGNTRLGTDKPHPRSLHSGLPVNSGEKWAMTLWWRQRQYGNPEAGASLWNQQMLEV